MTRDNEALDDGARRHLPNEDYQPCDVTDSPVRDGSGRVIGASKAARDLTERKRGEEAEANLRLHDEFLSVAAHELRTPVATLVGFAQLLERRLERETLSAEQLLATARQIRESGTKITGLINQLLDIGRIKGGQLQLERREVDLAALASEVACQVPDEDKGRITVVARESAPAHVDPMRIEQVVRNLLDNGLKYSSPGTPIELTVSRDAGAVQIRVRDRGIGVPEADRERIFGRFQRAHVGYAPGMGIGLYLTRQIVEQHGGTIHLEKVEGDGACFLVTLPTETRPSQGADSEGGS